MGKEAVREQFYVFTDTIIERALEAFEPLRVVDMNRLPGNSAVKTALTPVIRSELDEFHRQIESQFDVVMAYADAELNGGADRDEFGDAFLRHDIFLDNYEDGQRRDELRAELLDRLDMMGSDMAPLIAADTDDFWEAARTAYDADEASTMLMKHFAYTDTFQDYQDGLRFTVEVGNRLLDAEVEYTDEAVRVLEISETKLREDIDDVIAERWLDDD